MKKETKSLPKVRPALSPEAEEEVLISLAYNRAKEQLLDGTASSQVITHFLKLGTEKARLETKKIESDIALQEAKARAYEANDRIEALYSNAIEAMREYNGQTSNNEEEEYDD